MNEITEPPSNASDPQTESAAAAPGTPRHRWPRRLLKWVGLTLAVPLIVTVFALGAVLGTQSGLRAAFALGERLAPERVRVERVSGRVLGALALDGLHLDLPALRLDIERLRLDWSPTALLRGVVRVHALHGRGIRVLTVPAPEKESEPLFPLPEIRLPLRVVIDDARVDDLQLRQQGAAQPSLVLEQAVIVGGMTDSLLDLGDVQVRMTQPDLQVRLHGNADLTRRYPIDLTLDWQFAAAPALALTGAGTLIGDLSELVLEHHTDGSLAASIDARVRDLDRTPNWDAELNLQRIDLPDFADGLPALEASAQLQSTGTLADAHLTGDLSATLPEQTEFGELAARLNAGWRDGTVLLHSLTAVEQRSQAQLAASGRFAVTEANPAFALETHWQQLRWPLAGALQARSEQGQLQVDGRLDGFDYRLTAALDGPDLPSADITLEGAGDTTATRIDDLSIETLDGVLSGGGQLTWSPAPQWELDLIGRGIDPGRLVEGLDDRLDLHLLSAGDLDDYDLDLTATSSGPGLPKSALKLVGSGNREGARTEILRLETLDGSLTGEARVGFAPEVNWAAELRLADIDPGVFAPDWPGRISGQLTSSGRLTADGPDGRAELASLSGRLRGYPLAGEGQVEMAAGQVRVKDLMLRSGASKATVDGSIGDQLALRFGLDSPDLANLLPAARGRLTLAGTAGGSAGAPRLEANLNGRDIVLADTRIEQLDGQVTATLDQTKTFDVRLDAAGLAAGGQDWSALALRANGVQARHDATLKLTGKALSLDAAANGGLDGQGVYAGRLTRLDIDSQAAGQWGLQRPMPISAAAPRIGIGPLCLRQGAAARRSSKGSGGCLEWQKTATDRWLASADIDRLDFALLKDALPETLKAQGVARLKARFEAVGTRLAGSARADIPQGQLRVSSGEDKHRELDLNGSSLTLETGGSGLAAKLALPLAGIGGLQGQVLLPGWSLANPAAPNQALSGRLRGEVRDFKLFAHLLPSITHLTGALNADLELGGTLSRPGVRGQVRAHEINFDAPLTMTKVRGLNLALEAPSFGHLTIAGGAKIGGRQLDVDGSGTFGLDGSELRATIKGKRLKVADTKEYFLRLSPDLVVDAGLKGMTISGTLEVPEARIRPRDLPPGTVSPSGDVILADSEPTVPYPLSVDVKLAVGPDVTVDGFGLRGRLDGALKLLKAPGKEMLGNGQLQIVDGGYRITSQFGIAADLGTPLTITQGRLIYSGTPIGNPGLLLRAERSGGDVTAGVQVLGTLRNPELAFFSQSNPDMSSAEITKYLLTGVPPSSDEGPQAGLAAGTYVRPKVYMEYEAGLGGQQGKVRLRYDVSRHIEIQTETGESQGGDVFFSFER